MDSRTLWASAQPTAQACLGHPFVRGIADGSLARPAFTHYVAQDAFFLEAFARAYALGLARSPDGDVLRRFKALLDGAVDELDLHAGYAERWDVDLTPSPTAATRAYTDFLLRTAALEPLGNVLAAMTPCMRLYAWLGQQLAEDADPSSDYIDWVRTYAADDFEVLAATVEQLLDDLGGHPATLTDRYQTAMELELAFFDSAHASAAEGATDR
ncbi:TenA family protein [Euzebya sp.]|uniref:TenA family protein n=1 Tax=Euzebya sp. TaxID=1971409 RepID=UPI0035144384